MANPAPTHLGKKPRPQRGHFVVPACKGIAVVASSEPARAPAFPVLANLGLGMLLLGIVATWFFNAASFAGIQLGYLVLAVTTIALASIALVRPPARNCDERWWVYLVCVCSIFYMLGYRFDSQNGEFIFWGRVAAQLLANLWMLSLGRSYGMLPGLRTIRTRLLYNYIRHPAYAMYLLADLGTIALQPSLWNAGVALTGAVLFNLRASLEERVLCNDSAYADYMDRVRWRFVPGVW